MPLERGAVGPWLITISALVHFSPILLGSSIASAVWSSTNKVKGNLFIKFHDSESYAFFIKKIKCSDTLGSLIKTWCELNQLTHQKGIVKRQKILFGVESQELCERGTEKINSWSILYSKFNASLPRAQKLKTQPARPFGPKQFAKALLTNF